ncbi:ABC transporter permease [Lachnospiraceae bacterium ZAX-1]
MSKKDTNKAIGLKSNPFLKSIGTQRLIALLALIVLYILFGAINHKFFQYSTLVNIFDSVYYIGFMAIGVTFAIVTGGIDLSIGTVLTCSALIAGTLAAKYGVNIWICLIVGIVIGTAFGLANGFMVAYMGLPPFIATLGTMMLSKGLGSVFTGAQPATWPQGGTVGAGYRNIFKINITTETGKILIPTGFILLIVIAIAMAIFLNKTRSGRYIIALGSNYEATRLSGVKVQKYLTMAYVISGTLAGLAGISYAAIYTQILPGGGAGFELDAIAGVVIGGTSMSGGYGTVAGTLIGVFIMSVLKTGLPFIGLQAHYQQVGTGIVLIIAVFVDVWNRRKKN